MIKTFSDTWTLSPIHFIMRETFEWHLKFRYERDFTCIYSLNIPDILSAALMLEICGLLLFSFAFQCFAHCWRCPTLSPDRRLNLASAGCSWHSLSSSKKMSTQPITLHFSRMLFNGSFITHVLRNYDELQVILITEMWCELSNMIFRGKIQSLLKNVPLDLDVISLKISFSKTWTKLNVTIEMVKKLKQQQLVNHNTRVNKASQTGKKLVKY